MKAHGGDARGHYVGKATAYKVQRAGLWWSTLHNDVKIYCRACDTCQRIAGHEGGMN